MNRRDFILNPKWITALVFPAAELPAPEGMPELLSRLEATQ